MIKNNRSRIWLIKELMPLIFAVCVSILHYVLISQNDAYYLMHAAFTGIIGCLMILLFCWSWKFSGTSIVKSVLLGTSAVLVSFFGIKSSPYDMLYGIEVFLILIFPIFIVSLSNWALKKLITGKSFNVFLNLIPVLILMIIVCTATDEGTSEDYLILAVWLAESLLWNLALNPENQDAEKRIHIQWISWLVCLGIFLVFVSSHSDYVWILMNSLYWNKALILSLPLLYPFIFRQMCKAAPVDGRAEYMICAGYFGICTLLYFFSIGITHSRSMTMHDWSADLGLYYVILSIIVYIAEIKTYQRENAGKVRPFYTALFPALYAIVCIVITFFQNSRLREIVYNLGGPAIDVSEGDRVNWLAYRLAALKSFVSGNFEAFAGSWDLNNEGFQNLQYSYRWGAVAFRYGWWWLIAASALIIAAAVTMLRSEWSDPQLNRCKNYLAASYLLRLLMCFVFIVFMFTSYSIPFPFDMFGTMDLMILILLLAKGRSR